MIEKIMDGDLIIAPAKIKETILKELTKSKNLINVKIIDIEEFKRNYFGTYKNDALYYLMQKYGLNYDVAKEYLENLFYNHQFLAAIYLDLKNNGYLIFNEYFKQELLTRNIKVIGYFGIDKYLEDILNIYHAKYLESKSLNYQPQIYEFNDSITELNFICTDIIEKIKLGVNINDICLVNLKKEDELPLKRIFKMYHLTINYDQSKSIYSTKEVQDFLKYLNLYRTINTSLAEIKTNEIYDAIVDTLNKSDIPDIIDDTYLEFIKNELKSAKIKNKKYNNAVNIIDISEIASDKKYYYLLNFKEGIVPHLYLDDDLIKDSEKIKLGLNTSLMKIKNAKEQLKMIFENTTHLIVTYSLKDTFNSYLPSSLIKEWQLPVSKINSLNYNYSSQFNELELGKCLDNYYKYNEKDANFNNLFVSYPQNSYMSYNNQFKGIDNQELTKFLNNKINLAYSSMDNFYHCQFRYYIENILKLDPFQDTFMTFIGSLYHFCLSHIYDSSFDLESLYNEYLTKRNLTHKEKFFCEQLYQNLEFIIKTIKEQDRHSKFINVLTEKHMSVDKSHTLNVNFLGFIDKIKYENKDGKMYVAIIDYKTGELKTTLDNISYGLHLQLPVYIYLTSKIKNVKIAGFYLQKILNPKKFDSDDQEQDLKKDLRLDGYTIDSEDIIGDFDDTYISSDVIKGMSLTKNGFAKYTKLISEKDITLIIDLVDKLIDNAVETIQKGDFRINPKRINNVLIGCEYCHFKDLCYLKEENIVDLKNVSKNELLGGDQNEQMD